MPDALTRVEGWVCVTPQDAADLRAVCAEVRALRADKARLDWLEANPRRLYPCQDGDERGHIDFGWHIDFGGASGYCSATPRAALDAARTTTNTEGSADA